MVVVKIQTDSVISDLPLTGSATLGRLHNLSEPVFLHL